MKKYIPLVIIIILGVAISQIFVVPMLSGIFKKKEG